MMYPWWLSWFAELLYVVCAALICVAGFKLRYRHILRRQTILEETVEMRTEEIRVAQAALVVQATRDGLTGLLNRAEIQKRVADALLNHNGNTTMVVILIDIDHFKRINDTYGHLSGDEILKEMGQRILSAIRPGEYVGRYGGEEILGVLDDTDHQAASRVLALNESIRSTPFTAHDLKIPVTSSIGMSWAVQGDDWKSLIGRIDQALYKAKHQGRDQVVEGVFD